MQRTTASSTGRPSRRSIIAHIIPNRLKTKRASKHTWPVVETIYDAKTGHIEVVTVSTSTSEKT
jgi:hypothetical protein